MQWGGELLIEEACNHATIGQFCGLRCDTVAACSMFNFIGGSTPAANVGSFRPFTNGIFGSCYQFVLGMLVVISTCGSSHSPNDLHPVY
jgi:hypothetical protein